MNRAGIRDSRRLGQPLAVVEHHRIAEAGAVVQPEASGEQHRRRGLHDQGDEQENLGGSGGNSHV